MKVLGLTGGIGSGKSTVSQCLAELGAVVIDADKVGHEALRRGTQTWQEVVDAFGRQILAPDGEIDRKKLGEIVFSRPESLKRLNRIMHPRIHDMVKARVEEYRRQGTDVVVMEVPLLIESDWASMVDEIWVVAASERAVVERLSRQRGLTEEQILARIRSQLSTEERIKQADVVINNDGDIREVEAVVKEQWKRFHARHGTD